MFRIGSAQHSLFTKNKRYVILFAICMGICLAMTNRSFAADASLSTVTSPTVEESLVGKTPPRPTPKTIRSISIQIRDIFDPANNSVFRTANSVKINTKEKVIRRELLFKVGDTYDPFLVGESIRAIRLLKYLSDIKITPHFDGDFVDIFVSAQDTWTLLPQFNYSSGTGKNNKSAGLAESDIFGLGKRLEVQYSDDEGRKGLESVYDDPRIFGSKYRFLTAFFDRADGHREIFLLNDPYRSLKQKSAWSVSGDHGDTLGRLFDNGDVNYIFRQKKVDFEARYSHAYGNPEERVRRYSLGYGYVDARFLQANSQDYQDLNLDPKVVSNDPTRLPFDRRFTGPVFTYEQIVPDYISRNYVDRFERIDDYNLGPQESINILGAPKFLGSDRSAALFSANSSQGHKINDNAFVRSELGFAARLDDQDGLNDSLIRMESKFFDVLGPLRLYDTFAGKHTLAVSWLLEYGYQLDGDRQLVVGGDNAVRGYSARAFEGDKRFALNIEDRIHFVDNAFQLISVGGALFLDVGGATRDSIGNLLSDRIYSDVGFGLRLAFPRSTGERVARLDISLPLRDAQDGSNAYSPRIILSGGQLFGAQLRSESVGPEKASVEIGYDK